MWNDPYFEVKTLQFDFSERAMNILCWRDDMSATTSPPSISSVVKHSFRQHIHLRRVLGRCGKLNYFSSLKQYKPGEQFIALTIGTFKYHDSQKNKIHNLVCEMGKPFLKNNHQHSQ